MDKMENQTEKWLCEPLTDRKSREVRTLRYQEVFREKKAFSGLYFCLKNEVRKNVVIRRVVTVGY
ncbi:MAG: hypothetical protein D3923_09845 [Candidatus Electrothrix sp. AR3]|nr:hypothetical protein [Candidatus Electrothrix sp. AR3]